MAKIDLAINVWTVLSQYGGGWRRCNYRTCKRSSSSSKERKCSADSLPLLLGKLTSAASVLIWFNSLTAGFDDPSRRLSSKWALLIVWDACLGPTIPFNLGFSESRIHYTKAASFWLWPERRFSILYSKVTSKRVESSTRKGETGTTGNQPTLHRCNKFVKAKFSGVLTRGNMEAL